MSVLAPPRPRNLVCTSSFSTKPRTAPVSEGGMDSMTTPTSSAPLGLVPGADSSSSMSMRRVPAATSAMRSFHHASSLSCERGGRNVAMVRSCVMHCAWIAARYGMRCVCSVGEKRYGVPEGCAMAESGGLLGVSSAWDGMGRQCRQSVFIVRASPGRACYVRWERRA